MFAVLVEGPDLLPCYARDRDDNLRLFNSLESAQQWIWKQTHNCISVYEYKAVKYSHQNVTQ